MNISKLTFICIAGYVLGKILYFILNPLLTSSNLQEIGINPFTIILVIVGLIPIIFLLSIFKKNNSDIKPNEVEKTKIDNVAPKSFFDRFKDKRIE